MDQVSLTSAYMWAIVVMVIFFLIATLIANMVLYKPNNPGTAPCRLWFWILCVATGVVGFLINFFIGQGITVPTIKSAYLMHAAIATGVSVLLYIIIGFCVSKMFPSSKVGRWF